MVCYVHYRLPKGEGESCTILTREEAELRACVFTQYILRVKASRMCRLNGYWSEVDNGDETWGGSCWLGNQDHLMWRINCPTAAELTGGREAGRDGNGRVWVTLRKRVEERRWNAWMHMCSNCIREEGPLMKLCHKWKSLQLSKPISHSVELFLSIWDRGYVLSL